MEGASRGRLRGAAAALLALLLAPPFHTAAAEEVEPPASEPAPEETSSWRFAWDEGFTYELVRRLPRLQGIGDVSPQVGPWTWNPPLENEVALRGRIGARLHLDAASFAGPDGLFGTNTTAGVRRFRVYTQGEFQLLRPVDFKLEFGVSRNMFQFESGYLRLKQLPVVGTLTAGFQDAPVTLDALVSSSARTFLEPPTPVLAFASGTRLGFQVGRPVLDGRMTWAAGLFSDVGPREYGDDSDSLTRLTLRLTGLPRWREEGDTLEWIHVGLSGSLAATPNGSAKYRARPESYLMDYAVDTGEIESDYAGILGFEAAAARGQLLVQGELLLASVETADAGTLYFPGFYVQADWALTGESHPYDRAAGLPTRLVPARPFSLRGHAPGAVEVGARFSYLDLDDGPVPGGKIGLFGGVVTWTWNRHLRWQLDGHLGWVGGGRPSGAVAGIQARVQIDY